MPGPLPYWGNLALSNFHGDCWPLEGLASTCGQLNPTMLTGIFYVVVIFFFCGVICFYIQETNSGYQFSIYVARVCMTSICPGRGGRESLGKSAWSGLGWCFGGSQRSSLSPLSQLALAAIVLRVWMLSHCGISCAGWTHLGSKLLASIWVFGKYHTAVETCLTLT